MVGYGDESMSKLTEFLQGKIIDCEEIFANANTSDEVIFLQGLLKHGGETNALLMNIGKRQAYSEVLDFIRRNGDLQ